MQTVSERFNQAFLDGNRPVVAYADIFRDNAPIAGFSDIPLSSGTVKIDKTAANRRTMDVVVIDENGRYMPVLPSDPLMPFMGNELKIRTGFQFEDLTEETVSLGVFRIEDSGVAESGLIQVSGPDRSSAVAAARFEKPYVIPSGTNLATAVKEIMDSRLANLDWTQWSEIGFALTWTFFEEADRSGDPWQVCQDLMSSQGREVYFDPEGRPLHVPVPDVSVGSSVWTFEATIDAKSNLLSTAKTNTSKDVRNVWVVSGESAGKTPVRASAEITDPTSPIYPSPSGFGRRPLFYSSPFLKTTLQCQQVADAFKLLWAAVFEGITFSAIPHPALDADDIVTVIDADKGISTTTVLRSFDIDVFLSNSSAFTTTGRRIA